jgi:hypothetical protein
MKNPVYLIVTLIIGSITLTSCTTGSATRTSKEIYQPTDSASVEILFEKPTRPYKVIGFVGSHSSSMASDDAVFRAVQKEAAEIGAHAVLISDGIDHKESYWESHKKAKALAIRWSDEKANTKRLAVTPTSTEPTTPEAEQIIPKQ